MLSPEIAFTTDKYLAKLFIAAVVGDEFNVPTIAVLKSADEIARFDFPANCAVKPTHGTGQCLFVGADKSVDRALLNSWLETNWYRDLRQQNYRYLTPKIIVEPLIFGGQNVDDVKFHCVDGSVRMIQVDSDRSTRHTRRLFDRAWRDLTASQTYPLSDTIKPAPQRLDEMIQVAEKLAANFDLVRIDMYVDDESGDFLIGEVTHCAGGGQEVFVPKEAEWRVAELLYPTDSRRKCSQH